MSFAAIGRKFGVTGTTIRKKITKERTVKKRNNFGALAQW